MAKRDPAKPAIPNLEPVIPTDGNAGGASENSGANPNEPVSGNERIIDPSALDRTGSEPVAGGGSEPEEKGRGRGRPKGVRKEKSSAKEEGLLLNVSTLNNLLFTIHFSLSKIAGTPELELDAEESKKLAENMQNLMRHYPAMRFPQKQADWLMMMMALGEVYGPRVIAIGNRKARQRAEQKPAPQKQEEAKPAVNAAPEFTPADLGPVY